MNLKEILNVEPFEWKWVSEFKAKFWNDGLELTITLEPIDPFKFLSSSRKIHPINVMFGVEDEDGRINTDQTNKGNLRKVLVTVSTAVLTKLKDLDKKYEIDTVLLVSVGDEKREQRAKIYAWAANEMRANLEQSLGIKELRFESNAHNDYAILSKINFSEKEFKELNELVKKFEMNVR